MRLSRYPTYSFFFTTLSTNADDGDSDRKYSIRNYLSRESGLLARRIDEKGLNPMLLSGTLKIDQEKVLKLIYDDPDSSLTQMLNKNYDTKFEHHGPYTSRC